jgi:hypothetical protein
MTVIKDYAQKGGGCLCGAVKTYATWDKVNDVAKFSTDQGYWIKNAVYTTSGGCTYPNSYQDSVMIADVTSQGYTRVYWDKTVDNAYTCVTTTTTTTLDGGCPSEVYCDANCSSTYSLSWSGLSDTDEECPNITACVIGRRDTDDCEWTSHPGASSESGVGNNCDGWIVNVICNGPNWELDASFVGVAAGCYIEASITSGTNSCPTGSYGSYELTGNEGCACIGNTATGITIS